MDSIKALKGYGKVGPVQDPPKPHKRILLLVIAVVAAVALLSILIVYVSPRNHAGGDSGGGGKVSLITAVCNRTAHPAVCVASLQNSTKAADVDDPEQLVKLSLKVSLQHLVSLSEVELHPADPRLAAAANDCRSLIADAVDGVNASVAVMEVPEGGAEMVLTLMKINDMQTWVSAAVTNLETCVDGVKEMGGGDGAGWGQLETGVSECEVYLSNSLGIIARIVSILDELHIPLH